MKLYFQSPFFAFILILLPICHSFECFDCVETEDIKCKDPFDNSTMKPVDCDAPDYKKRPYVDPEEHRKDRMFEKAIGCRKTLQELDGKITIVRQCAFGGENADGAKRIGNKGVRLFYYQCSEPLCNAAQSLNSFFLVTSALIVAVLTIGQL